MIQTLIRNWWLLALCGILDAMYSITNLFTQDPEGYLTLRTFVGVGAVRYMGKLALAAGLCTVLAGIWRSRSGRPWLLILNGLALAAFGLLGLLWDVKRTLSFLPVAILFAVMGMSIGVFALMLASTLRVQAADKLFLCLAGILSIAFSIAFLLMGLRWIRLEPLPFLVWMSAYFGFSAVCMLAMGLRLNRLRLEPLQ